VSIYDRPWWPWQAKAQRYAFSCIVCLINPQSRGRVWLRSANPADPPRIQLNIFSEQADVDLAVAGIRRTREVYAAEPQASLIRAEVLPGPAAQSDAELGAHVRATASTMQHPASTCRMGIDAAAVVDAELKVRGIDGLRVADASIFPSIPGGNINAPTIMVGEKAADLLRGQELPPEP
jgi:choline dehydrogenase-like flavoprotein